jgi:hypothetical protein
MNAYETVGEEGRSEWRKSLVSCAWQLYDAAVDLVYQGDVRHGEHVPAHDAICSAARLLEDGNKREAALWLRTAIAMSVDNVQKQQVRYLLARIE